MYTPSTVELFFLAKPNISPDIEPQLYLFHEDDKSLTVQYIVAVLAPIVTVSIVCTKFLVSSVKVFGLKEELNAVVPVNLSKVKLKLPPQDV